MLDTVPTEEIQKRQFLMALREPLRSAFALMDDSTVPLTEIVNRALNLDHQQLGHGLSQFRTIAPSPKAEEKAFQQALQCTLCLHFGHTNVDYIQRCALCQARSHTTATCEYNLLARRNAPAVQTVQPVPVQPQGQCDNNRFYNVNRGSRQFQRKGWPQFQSSQFRQKEVDRCQENGPQRPQGHCLLSLLVCQPGHFAMDCPHPPPGQASNQGEASTSKGLSVSLITPTVQLVTTRNRARMEQWADQDRVRQQAQNWVEEANAQNDADRQTQEAQRAATGKAVLAETAGPSGSGTEPEISDLAGIQVTMTLEQLLRLVPRFRDGIRRTLEGTAT
jgi:hypothetical protein